MILLIALLSTHILIEPSFLGTSRAGTAQGLRLSRIKPLPSSSSTCLCTSWVSCGFMRYAGLFGRVAPGMRSILCWMVLLGGRPWGTSLGKTCSYSLRRGISNGWEESFAWAGSWPRRIHSLKSWYSCNWEWRRVVRKTSTFGLFCGFFCEEGLRGVRVILLWSFAKE